MFPAFLGSPTFTISQPLPGLILVVHTEGLALVLKAVIDKPGMAKIVRKQAPLFGNGVEAVAKGFANQHIRLILEQISLFA